MVNDDLELDGVEDESEQMEELSPKEYSGAADARRRLDAKLEEARLKKLLSDYDFD